MMRFLVFALALSGPAQAADEHPIEARLAACMEKDGSTAGMVACEDAAYREWDAELNRVYNLLRKRLTGPSAEALKTAQLAWIKHRDAELAWIRALYNRFDGTMYRPMAVDAAKEVVRRRAEELKRYLDTWDEHGQQPKE
jgi:uncharacterized protein YecT (DUF1311 family)